MCIDGVGGILWLRHMQCYCGHLEENNNVVYVGSERQRQYIFEDIPI